jgi:hypothetical protein
LFLIGCPLPCSVVVEELCFSLLFLYHYIGICYLLSFSNIVITFMICRPVSCNDSEKIDLLHPYPLYLFC